MSSDIALGTGYGSLTLLVELKEYGNGEQIRTLGIIMRIGSPVWSIKYNSFKWIIYFRSTMITIDRVCISRLSTFRALLAINNG